MTVNYATANGTATAGSDYVAQTGNLTFTAGQTSKTIAVVVNGDTTVEPNETFVVNLTEPRRARRSPTARARARSRTTTPTPPPSRCRRRWCGPRAVGVTVTGNSLTKTAATGWGNAGAVSTQQIASGDGYVEFTASETTTYRMLGLSNGNTNASYEDIDFALYLTAAARSRSTRRAPSRARFGTYAAGDKLRVAVGRRGRQVLARTESSSTPRPRPRPTRSSSTPPSTPRARPSAAPSSPGRPRAAASPAERPARWCGPRPSGVTVSGNSLTKTAATGWGNAGAVSTQQIASGDGYVEFTASETSTYRMLGLSNGNTRRLLRGHRLRSSSYARRQIQVYENGTSRGTFGAYATGDKLRVAVVGGVVKYSGTGPSSTPRRRPRPTRSSSTPRSTPGRHPQQRRRRVRRTSVTAAEQRPVGLDLGGGRDRHRQLPHQDGRHRLGQRRRRLHPADRLGRRLRRVHRLRDQHLPHARPRPTATPTPPTRTSTSPYRATPEARSTSTRTGTLPRGPSAPTPPATRSASPSSAGSSSTRKNGTVFYTSTQAPTYPLLVDTSLYTTGATLNYVVVTGAQ